MAKSKQSKPVKDRQNGQNGSKRVKKEASMLDFLKRSRRRTKAKEQEEAAPEAYEFPCRAYAYRLLPEKAGGRQIAGRLTGDFDGFYTLQDLEDLIAKVHGGGTYRCKVVKSDDTTHYLTYHTFKVPGSPIFEGSILALESEPESKRREGDDPVAKIEKTIQVEEAETKLDEIRARRRAKAKALGMVEGDDDETPSPFPVPGQFEDPRVTQLLAAQEDMRRRLEEKDRQMMAERHEAELRTLREEMTRKIESVSARPDSGIGTMLSAQMEAIKAMMASSQQSTQAMLSSNSEMIKLIMSRDPSTGINDRVDRLVEKLLDSKSSTGKEVMEAMKESFQTGIMMARGGEQAPTSMADVAREFSGRVLDIVGDFMRQKGEMSKEALAQEIQKATSKVVDGVRRQLAPLATARHRLPPGGIPASEAMPAPAGQAGPPDDALRAQVDKVMEAFLRDIENGTETWQQVAQEAIPASEMAKIGEFTFENIARFAMQHGSPELVRRVMIRLQEISNKVEQEAQDETAPAEPAGEVSQSQEPIFADEEDPDDVLMDGPPVAQGENQEAAPKRKTRRKAGS